MTQIRLHGANDFPCRKKKKIEQLSPPNFDLCNLSADLMVYEGLAIVQLTFSFGIISLVKRRCGSVSSS